MLWVSTSGSLMRSHPRGAKILTKCCVLWVWNRLYVLTISFMVRLPSIHRVSRTRRCTQGSTDKHKVWLNGTLVDEDLNNIWAEGYANIFPVTLKRGTNVLLVAVDNSWGWNWGGYFGFEAGTDYTLSSPQVGYTFSEAAIHVGDTFTLDINAPRTSTI